MLSSWNKDINIIVIYFVSRYAFSFFNESYIWAIVISCLIKRTISQPFHHVPLIKLFIISPAFKVYSFRLCVRLFRPFVCSFVRYSVLLMEFTSKLSESIHIWVMGTLEDQIWFHQLGPPGSCPEEGLEVKIWDSLTKCYTAHSFLQTTFKDIRTDISHPYDFVFHVMRWWS